MDCVTSEMHKFTIKQEKNLNISICGLDTNIKSPRIMCVQYTGACSVHRGVFSALGVFSTLGEYHEYIGGVQYIGGYHEYIGGCSVHRRDTMSTSGDVQYIGGCHEY